ncbi:UNVERIFIED_CONTAM: hypothetical protein RMT77_003033 [Armadillidium vulgare]
MANFLEKLFTKVPVPILPDPCFDTSSIFDSNSLLFEDMYVKVNASANDHPLSQWKPFESNISYYNFIIKNSCPMKDLVRHRNVFKSLLKIRKMHKITSKFMLSDALENTRNEIRNATLICTHVRRSDYLNYIETKNLVFPTETYYKNAFEFFRRNCKYSVFVVVSDDVEWCKENLSAPDVVFPGISYSIFVI